MRSHRIIIALAALMLVISYSVAATCEDQAEVVAQPVEAIAVVSDADDGKMIGVTISCGLLEEALRHGVIPEMEQPSPAQKARQGLRAAVGLTRALSRAATHLTVALARTAYHTVTALT